MGMREGRERRGRRVVNSRAGRRGEGEEDKELVNLSEETMEQSCYELNLETRRLPDPEPGCLAPFHSLLAPFLSLLAPFLPLLAQPPFLALLAANPPAVLAHYTVYLFLPEVSEAQ